jgi:hypothetical protein
LLSQNWQAARVQPQTTYLTSPLQNDVVQSQNKICSYSTSKLKSLVVFEDQTRRAEKVAKDKKKKEPRLCTMVIVLILVLIVVQPCPGSSVV